MTEVVEVSTVQHVHDLIHQVVTVTLNVAVSVASFVLARRALERL